MPQLHYFAKHGRSLLHVLAHFPSIVLYAKSHSKLCLAIIRQTNVLLLSAKIYLSSILRVYVCRSYHTVNTLHLCYKDQLVMPFSEIIAVYSEKHTKHKNTFDVQHASLLC